MKKYVTIQENYTFGEYYFKANQQFCLTGEGEYTYDNCFAEGLDECHITLPSYSFEYNDETIWVPKDISVATDVCIPDEDQDGWQKFVNDMTDTDGDMIAKYKELFNIDVKKNFSKPDYSNIYGKI